MNYLVKLMRRLLCRAPRDLHEDFMQDPHRVYDADGTLQYRFGDLD